MMRCVGTPSTGSGVKIEALQETVTHLMAQLQSQGSKFMDMELREQKLLADLKTKCDKVLLGDRRLVVMSACGRSASHKCLCV